MLDRVGGAIVVGPQRSGSQPRNAPPAQLAVTLTIPRQLVVCVEPAERWTSTNCARTPGSTPAAHIDVSLAAAAPVIMDSTRGDVAIMPATHANITVRAHHSGR